MSRVIEGSVHAAGKRFIVLEENDGLLRAITNGMNGYDEVWARESAPGRNDGYIELVKRIERALNRIPTRYSRKGYIIKKSLTLIWPGIPMPMNVRGGV